MILHFCRNISILNSIPVKALLSSPGADLISGLINRRFIRKGGLKEGAGLLSNLKTPFSS